MAVLLMKKVFAGQEQYIETVTIEEKANAADAFNILEQEFCQMSKAICCQKHKESNDWVYRSSVCSHNDHFLLHPGQNSWDVKALS